MLSEMFRIMEKNTGWNIRLNIFINLIPLSL